METSELSYIELRRYDRQIKLEELGKAGQLKLKQSNILVVGAGGLGTPVLQYLAAAGIGSMAICDADYVDESNFHRQIMYGASDLGKLKTIVAKEKLQLLNPFVNYTIINIFVSLDNVTSIIKDYDVVVDCTNNLVTSYILSEGCSKLHKPMVFGTVNKLEGTLSVLFDKSNSNLHEILQISDAEVSQNNESEVGAIGFLYGIMGCLQANEVIKILLGIGETLSDKLLLYNGLKNEFIIHSLEKK
jgi:sulfur-carrier protein adenylyltransferase/sulfurtransferase